MNTNELPDVIKNASLNQQLDFIGALLLFQHKRDQALGFTWHSQKTLGLAWYYNQLQYKRLCRSIDPAELMAAARELVEHAATLTDPAERQAALDQLNALRRVSEEMI